jgi:hypothetical protein
MINFATLLSRVASGKGVCQRPFRIARSPLSERVQAAIADWQNGAQLLPVVPMRPATDGQVGELRRRD